MKADIFERKFQGKAIERGGTARGFGSSPAPALKKLFDGGAFQGAKTVIDFGAGVGGRNSNFLREAGLKVYSFDPYNGTAGADGWQEVTTEPPKGKFDIGFTSFVLNVVPEKVEKKIIKDLQRLAKESYHITRNLDIFVMVKNALARRDPQVTNFFLEHFADEEEIAEYEAGTLSDDVIMEFCQHGLETRSGFQRIPVPEETSGLTLLRRTQGFKVYKA